MMHACRREKSIKKKITRIWHRKKKKEIETWMRETRKSKMKRVCGGVERMKGIERVND